MLVLARLRDETIEIGQRGEYLLSLPDSVRKIVIESVLANPLLSNTSAADVAKLFEQAERGPIKVTVVDIRGDKVRLGTDAPKNFEVHRTEVADRKALEARYGVQAVPA